MTEATKPPTNETQRTRDGIIGLSYPERYALAIEEFTTGETAPDIWKRVNESMAGKPDEEKREEYVKRRLAQIAEWEKSESDDVEPAIRSIGRNRRRYTKSPFLLIVATVIVLAAGAYAILSQI